jgi:hypothetical protein
VQSVGVHHRQDHKVRVAKELAVGLGGDGAHDLQQCERADELDAVHQTRQQHGGPPWCAEIEAPKGAAGDRGSGHAHPSADGLAEAAPRLVEAVGVGIFVPRRRQPAHCTKM